ncbi:MAG: hypothetical protein FJY77_00010 [Candidatus Altiarchaeales archaeon]|nr:hypothetical protein [Candidatus Altiarchaeales archaeon]
MASKEYFIREEAYKEVDSLVEEASKEENPYFMVNLLMEKKKLDFKKDFPQHIVERLECTATHANIEHDAYRFNIGEVWNLLEVQEIKEFLKTLLDNQKWFVIAYKEAEIYFVEK